MPPTQTPPPLAIRDCTVTALATGLDALNLREMRDRMERIPDGSLYYHFWGRLLRPVFGDREYSNDFADWAAHGLRDRVLAERLALVDPAEVENTAKLREEVLDVMEVRLDELDHVPWAPRDHAFHFIQGRIVVFDTHRRAEDPKELAGLCPQLSLSSVFYHFVDGRHRSPEGRDDFQQWLEGFGGEYRDLCDELSRVDVHFTTLDHLRDRLHRTFEGALGGAA